MWFYTYQGHQLGPVDMKGLRNLMRTGGITAATMVMEESWDEWKRLNETDLIWLYEEILQNKGLSASSELLRDEEDEEAAEDEADESAEEDEKIWFYQMNGMHLGPVGVGTIERMLHRGDLNEVSLVRRDGEFNWHHLDETDLIWTLQSAAEDTDDEDYEEDDEEVSEGDSEPQELLDEAFEEGETAWYYQMDENLYGPVTSAEIVTMRAQGEVYGQTPVATDRNGPWKMLDETELADLRPDDFEQEEE
jgi:hypothetical protein